jgi:hypothetical protein
MKRPLSALFVVGAAVTLLPLRVNAQAFTAPEGVGQVTIAWQRVENEGHRFSDGFLLARGQSVTMSALFEVDYGITDRFSATAGIPYVFARYTGANPPPSGLPLDACGCWHSTFQDLSLAARYRFGDDPWAVTPIVRYVLPSHGYRYVGEAVVGRNLWEAQVGVDAARRLSGALRKATVQAGYTYAFVEKPLPDVSNNRSNAVLDIGYALTKRLYIHGTSEWQKTNGGLRIGSPTGHPFFPPGELNTPQRFAQQDRVLAAQYWHAGGGLTWSFGPIDVFASFTKYLDGKNTHDGRAYTIGTTWYFDRSRL